MYLGIDQSLTSTGICVLDESDNAPIYMAHTATSKFRGGERLAKIEEEILYAVKRFKPYRAAMEGYSYESVGKVFELGEVGGITKLALFKEGVPFVVAAPAAVKKFAGNAKADKEAVARLVKAKWNRDITQNDECDAYVLAQIARAFSKSERIVVRAEMEVIKALQEKSYEPPAVTFNNRRSNNT